MMQTVIDKLPLGVEFNGKFHKDFELRAQLVSDTVDVFDNSEHGKRAEHNNQFFAACVMAGRLVKLGEIPKEQITVDLILAMEQDDYNALLKAGERLEQQLATFRGQAAPVAQEGAGAAEAGV